MRKAIEFGAEERVAASRFGAVQPAAGSVRLRDPLQPPGPVALTSAPTSPTDWSALWRTGVLPRFCFVTLGITFHAGAENMISTIMPSMVREIGGIEMAGWSFAIYEIGSIVAGAATGRLTTFWTVRTNMVVAALIFAAGALVTGLHQPCRWHLAGVLSAASAAAP